MNRGLKLSSIADTVSGIDCALRNKADRLLRTEMKMKLTDFFLAELEREVSSSRLALQRVPEDHNDWKPHPKSMPLGYLASLVATMPSWIVSMVKQDELDLKSPAAAKFVAEQRAKDKKWVEEVESLLASESAPILSGK